MGASAGVVRKREFVIVVEGRVSEARMRESFAAVTAMLGERPEVDAYNQSI